MIRIYKNSPSLCSEVLPKVPLTNNAKLIDIDRDMVPGKYGMIEPRDVYKLSDSWRHCKKAGLLGYADLGLVRRQSANHVVSN